MLPTVWHGDSVFAPFALSPCMFSNNKGATVMRGLQNRMKWWKLEETDRRETIN